MKTALDRPSRPLIVTSGITLLTCFALSAGISSFSHGVASQELIKITDGREKQMENNEKASVEVLRSNQILRTSPEKVLEAIDELGKVAQLRGISSTDTLKALAEYLDVHKDSLVRPNENSGLPELDLPHLKSPQQERYPAVVALMHARKAALPILVSVIENHEIGSVSSNNAIYVLKFNFRDDFNNAADYLREASESSKLEEGRRRLLIVADKIARNIF